MAVFMLQSHLAESVGEGLFLPPLQSRRCQNMFDIQHGVGLFHFAPTSEQLHLFSNTCFSFHLHRSKRPLSTSHPLKLLMLLHLFRVIKCSFGQILQALDGVMQLDLPLLHRAHCGESFRKLPKPESVSPLLARSFVLSFRPYVAASQGLAAKEQGPCAPRETIAKRERPMGVSAWAFLQTMGFTPITRLYFPSQAMHSSHIQTIWTSSFLDRTRGKFQTSKSQREIARNKSMRAGSE